MAIRFHLDENVSSGVAVALLRRGLDVTTAWQAELLGAEDRAHIDYARASGRIIVIHDDDFTRLHALGIQHSGICYCLKQKHSIGDLVRLLLLVHECFSADEMQGHLEYL
jgi:hypothetical protein